MSNRRLPVVSTDGEHRWLPYVLSERIREYAKKRGRRRAVLNKPAVWKTAGWKKELAKYGLDQVVQYSKGDPFRVIAYDVINEEKFVFFKLKFYRAKYEKE